MAHRVRITPEAEADLRSIGDYIARDSPERARRFIAKLKGVIATLTNFPERHAKAPEAELAGVELRQMTHGLYRVLYTVEEDSVTIHGVRHGARRPLRPDELPDS
jgi:plasmid stabilization system protein ParE